MNEDVIGLILEHLYRGDDLKPDYRNLSSYARVARAWGNPAQRLLFRHVIVDDEKSFNSIQHATRPGTPRGDLLPRYVRILEYPKVSSSSPFRQKWEGRLPTILNLFPLLYEVRVLISDLDQLSPNTLRALESTPPIIALRISMTASPVRTAESSIVPVQLLQVKRWPLKYIVIHGSPFALDRVGGLPPCHHKFEYIKFTLTDHDRHTFIPWLWSSSASSLRTIRLLDLVGSYSPPHFPNLRSLHCSLHDQQPHVPLDKLCNPAKLVEYGITAKKWERHDYADPDDQSWKMELPPNVEHLIITLAGYRGNVEWIERFIPYQIGVPTCRIRKVSVLNTEGKTIDQTILKTICARLLLELEVIDERYRVPFLVSCFGPSGFGVA